MRSDKVLLPVWSIQSPALHPFFLFSQCASFSLVVAYVVPLTPPLTYKCARVFSPLPSPPSPLPPTPPQGLGTSTPKEAKEYFAALERHRKKFHWTGEEDSQHIEMAFSKKQADQRKNWLRGFTVGGGRARGRCYDAQGYQLQN